MQFRQKWIVFTSWLEDAGHSVRGGWIELQKRKSIKGGEIVASYLYFPASISFKQKNKWSTSTCQISDIIQVSDNLGSDNALKVDFLKIQSPHFRGNFARAFGMMVMMIMMMMMVVHSSDHFHYSSDISAPITIHIYGHDSNNLCGINWKIGLSSVSQS